MRTFEDGWLMLCVSKCNEKSMMRNFFFFHDNKNSHWLNETTEARSSKWTKYFYPIFNEIDVIGKHFFFYSQVFQFLAAPFFFYLVFLLLNHVFRFVYNRENWKLSTQVVVLFRNKIASHYIIFLFIFISNIWKCN